MPRKVSRYHIVLSLIVVALIAFAAVKFVSYAQKKPAAPTAPSVTATETLTDPSGLGTDNNDGKAQPGETLLSTVTITNSGTDATGVSLADSPANPLSPNGANGTALIGTIAANDTYNTIGNVKMLIPTGAGGVLNNDMNPSGSGTLAVASFGFTAGTANANAAGATATTANTSSVTLASDGAFTYDPGVGFTGSEDIFYTLTNGVAGNPTSVGKITVTTANKIWFINNNAGACPAAPCDGRLSHPFTDTPTFQTANTGAAGKPAAGDYIFISSSGSNYNGSIAPQNNQIFIGQGASATIQAITGFTAPSGTSQLPGTGAAPTLGTTAAGTNAVTLNAGINATLRGFNIGNTTNFKIFSSGFGTLTTSEIVLGGTGGALSLTGGSFASGSSFTSVTSTSSATTGITLSNLSVASAGTVSFGSTTISGSTGVGISVAGSSANVNFGNTSVTGGTSGISLANNSTGGTRTFGTLNITGGTSGTGFLYSGGGNVTVTGATTISADHSSINLTSVTATSVVNFAGATSGTTLNSGLDGVFYSGVAGASATFNSLSIATNAGIGLHATGGGTFTVTNGTGTINSTPQAAPAIVAANVALNANFLFANSSGGTNGISLTSVTGTSTISGGALSGASGDEFFMSGQNGTFTYNGAITSGSAHSVNVTGKTGGAVTLGGLVTDTDTGITLTTNTGATIAFAGGISASTGTNPAFTATGGGTVTVTGVSNTLATTTGTALNVANTTIGASGLTFRSINTTTSSSNSGIVLNTTGAGGLSVTGTGSANSGGTISNKTGAADGVSLTSASNISLTDMVISTIGGSWIDATTVNGLTLTRLNADLSTDHGIKASSLTNLTIAGGTFDQGGAGSGVANVNGVDIHNLLGTSSVTGATFKRSNTIQFHVNNDVATSFGGTPDQLTVSNTQWNTHTGTGPGEVPFAGDHLSVNSDTGGNFRLIVNNTGGTNTFVTGGTAVQATSGGTSGKMDTDISGVTSGGTLASGNNNTALAVIGETGTGSAIITFNVHNNTSLGTGSVGIKVTHASAGGTSHGTIQNNSITHVAGPGTDAIAIDVQGAGAVGTYTIANNTVTGNYQRGITVQSGLNGTINATVNNNHMTGTDTTGQGLQQIAIFAGISGGTAATTRLNMFSNDVHNGAGATYTADYRLNNMVNSTFQLQDFAGSGSSVANIQSWVTTTKTNTAAGTGTVTVNINSNFSASAGPIPTSPDLGSPSDIAFERALPLGNANAEIALADPPVNTLGEMAYAEIAGATSLGDTANAEFIAKPGVAATENNPSLIAELYDKLTRSIEPTVEAQSGPTSGSITTSPTFTLPAGSSVTITYQLTVANGPYPAGLNNLTDAAGVSWTGTPAGNTTVSPAAAIPLDASPSISIANSDASTETQPGATITYAVSATNALVNNGQDATGVVLTETIPTNTVFDPTASASGWNCPTPNTSGTTCTNTIPVLTASGTATTRNFAVDVTGPLAANVLTVGNTASVADDGTNGANQGTPISQVDTDTVRGTWVGTTSNDFSVATNWVNGLLPNSGQNISIPTGGGANSPSILSGTVVTNNVFFSGKSLTIASGANLTANTSVSLGSDKVLGAGTLELGQGATISRTTGQVNCSLQKDFLNGALTEGAEDADAPDAPQVTTFTYPVGTASGFFPVDVTPTGGSTGSLTVQTFDGTTGVVPPLDNTKTLQRYWTLSSTGSVTADVKFTYGATATPGTEANYKPQRVTAGVATSFIDNCPSGSCVDETNNFIFMPAVSTFGGNWTASELAPTAAQVNVSGRVVDSNGHGIRNARVTIDDGTGHPMTAISNAFGYYHFDTVQAGGTYMLNANARGYTFSPRVVPVTDQLSDLDLTALP